MVLRKYPSPAHKTRADAYWIGHETDDAGSTLAVLLGQRERRIGEIVSPVRERILRALDGAGQGRVSHMMYNCHELAEHIFGEPGNFRRLRLMYPRGSVMGPELAAEQFGLPCGIQFQNPGDAHLPVIHSAVLLGMDGGLPAELPASERAIVLHKPGREELEIVTLADAVRRYADRLRDITYYGV